MNEVFANVWDAIAENPAEAEKLKLQSALMDALCEVVQREALTKKEAAKRFGVTQPRVADLLRGRLSKFQTDDLLAMLTAAGLHVEVQIDKAA